MGAVATVDRWFRDDLGILQCIRGERRCGPSPMPPPRGPEEDPTYQRGHDTWFLWCKRCQNQKAAAVMAEPNLCRSCVAEMQEQASARACEDCRAALPADAQ